MEVPAWKNENQADAAWKIQADKAGTGFYLFPFEDISQGHGGGIVIWKKYLTGALGAAAFMKNKKRFL